MLRAAPGASAPAFERWAPAEATVEGEHHIATDVAPEANDRGILQLERQRDDPLGPGIHRVQGQILLQQFPRRLKISGMRDHVLKQIWHEPDAERLRDLGEDGLHRVRGIETIVWSPVRRDRARLPFTVA